MLTVVKDNAHSVTTEVTQLLAGLGYDVERLGGQTELAIERFDQWTNPQGAMLNWTSSRWSGPDVELERAAA